MAKKMKSGMKDKRTSAAQNTSVGSGSRPNGGRIKIGTTSAKDPHTLDRSPKNPLK